MSRSRKLVATEGRFEFTPDRIHQLVYKPYAEPKKMYANLDAVSNWFNTVLNFTYKISFELLGITLE